MNFTYREPAHTCPKIDIIKKDIVSEITGHIDDFRELNSSLRDEFNGIISECIIYYEDIIEQKDEKIIELESEIERITNA